MTFPPVNRKHHILGRILSYLDFLRSCHSFPKFHRCSGMRDPCDTPQHHRSIEFLADLEGVNHKILRFLAIARFQHGYFSKLCVITIVLLILRAVKLGIIRCNNHKASTYPRITQGHQGIRRHVYPNMLHGCHGPRPCKGRPHGHFQGYLFIRRPFGIDFGILLRHRFQDFRARCSRIGRSKSCPCFIGSPGNGLIS